MRSHNPDRVSSGGLASSAFARHYSRNRVCFLFLEVLRCFTSLGSLVRAYGFSAPYGGITRRGFPHSDILRIKAWLAAPRSLSQLPASFFASCRLGIHRVPFPAWSSSLLAPNSTEASRPEDQGPARSHPHRG